VAAAVAAATGRPSLRSSTAMHGCAAVSHTKSVCGAGQPPFAMLVRPRTCSDPGHRTLDRQAREVSA
jgi:hypothetical protein